MAGKRGLNSDYLRPQGMKKDLELDIFKWLMDKGLNPTMADREQRTPLFLAMAACNDRDETNFVLLLMGLTDLIYPYCYSN